MDPNCDECDGGDCEDAGVIYVDAGPSTKIYDCDDVFDFLVGMSDNLCLLCEVADNFKCSDNINVIDQCPDNWEHLYNCDFNCLDIDNSTK
jgi:hypothetical protein